MGEEGREREREHDCGVLCAVAEDCFPFFPSSLLPFHEEEHRPRSGA